MTDFKLSNGLSFPSIGFGTYRIKGDNTVNIIIAAIESGYRLIDTASVYSNEEEIGKAIKSVISKGIVKREQLFITSKLGKSFSVIKAPKEQGFQNAYDACLNSIKRLGLDYLDCYLIHWPGTQGLKPNDPQNKQNRQESWKALEKLYKEGKVKSIGISNFTQSHIEDLLKEAEIMPHVHQYEFHPLCYDYELLSFCQSKNIQVQAYSSFGEGVLLEKDERLIILDQLAEKYQKSKAQILLRWALDLKVAVIPKTVLKERMQQNLDLDFSLQQEEIEAICSTSKTYFEKYCWDPKSVA